MFILSHTLHSVKAFLFEYSIFSFEQLRAERHFPVAENYQKIRVARDKAPRSTIPCRIIPEIPRFHAAGLPRAQKAQAARLTDPAAANPRTLRSDVERGEDERGQTLSFEDSFVLAGGLTRPRPMPGQSPTFDVCQFCPLVLLHLLFCLLRLRLIQRGAVLRNSPA